MEKIFLAKAHWIRDKVKNKIINLKHSISTINTSVKTTREFEVSLTIEKRTLFDTTFLQSKGKHVHEAVL